MAESTLGTSDQARVPITIVEAALFVHSFSSDPAMGTCTATSEDLFVVLASSEERFDERHWSH